MKLQRDIRAIETLAGPQRGVFSTADLQTALAEVHLMQLDDDAVNNELVGSCRRKSEQGFHCDCGPP